MLKFMKLPEVFAKFLMQGGKFVDPRQGKMVDFRRFWPKLGGGGGRGGLNVLSGESPVFDMENMVDVDVFVLVENGHTRGCIRYTGSFLARNLVKLGCFRRFWPFFTILERKFGWFRRF